MRAAFFCCQRTSFRQEKNHRNNRKSQWSQQQYFQKTMTFYEKEDMEKKEKSNLSIKFPEGKNNDCV
ncbi:hypothetical protein CG712_07745 [Streptococcus thermophilus]|nr:hypothetical protein AVT04_03270 [Streptococcus thermophilus]ANS61098.1 hypothetical protein BAY21_03190 [Streptococcus thermophilus]ATH75703.1 hypothetical protein CG712_07745 [Streptococcus thermophilus]MCT2904695.1 hypothetical protein [Streptococcus thermophilus]MCT2922203.1 hypothetical protein [Streptococcus thermophilus]